MFTGILYAWNKLNDHKWVKKIIRFKIFIKNALIFKKYLYLPYKL